ncbi:hypothetical protein BP6252_05471 [Coleophoma cylindrospora]|uniref:Myb-like domain-containing protein n=1 Tax=Coleophoma cylindrospora TaxID=1849047 RepID=A0A3D8RTY4_9HELO|nr:hypothetical protein BP6252_05471 [Coleophoma cylindrospora]
MNATIEPSLLALLNNDKVEDYLSTPSLELPPLQDPNILKASGRPLLLEPDASHRVNKTSSTSQLVSQHATLINASFDDGESRHDGNESRKSGRKEHVRTDRALGSTSPQSLRKILDDSGASATNPISKKRHIDNAKEDFVQLPQPLPKKQKSTKQVVVPPIINGIHELPPQVALFPPIASSSFHDSHGRNSLNMVSASPKEPKENPFPEDAPLAASVKDKQPLDKRSKRKGVKPYKRWSEEETSSLLKGVHKHGIGCWADILGDPEFSFNNRTAVDLKDRFRTCCPAELRGKVARSAKSSPSPGKDPAKGHASTRVRSSLMTENILIPTDSLSEDATPGPEDVSTKATTSKKTRKRGNHRKNLDDLASLGIEGPFRMSQRRGRRLFSEKDDRQILEGYKCYGTQWTKIQRDPRFQLQDRTPTDLRDRFRNKFPEKFSHTEDLTEKDHLRTAEPDKEREKEKEKSEAADLSSLLNPSSREHLRIQQMISADPEKSVPGTVSQPNQAQSAIMKDSFPPMPEHAGVLTSADHLSFSQPIDWNEGIVAPFSGSLGDMDISRLLLEEPWSDNVSNFAGGKKQSYTNINSICTSNADAPLSQAMSFTNLLGYDIEPLSSMQSSNGMIDYSGE